MNCINIIAYSLCLFGLFADIFGAIGLFITVSKPISKLPKFDFNPPEMNATYGWNNDNSVNEERQKTKMILNNYTDEVNRHLTIVNSSNKKLHQESKWYLRLLIGGFLLQFSGLLMQFYLSLN